jgi:hypothetical protein
MEEVATRPHPDHPRCFERAKPNQLCRLICSRLSSSGKIGGSTSWLFWTTTAASSSATVCTPASPRPWCWRCCGRP